MSNTTELVTKFVAACAKEGFSYSCKESIVTVYKSFAAGDKAAYCDADMVAGDLLALVPASGGSVWGTDGATIGGAVGLSGGYYCLNVSGVSKRFTKELCKGIYQYGRSA